MGERGKVQIWTNSVDNILYNACDNRVLDRPFHSQHWLKLFKKIFSLFGFCFSSINQSYYIWTVLQFIDFQFLSFLLRSAPITDFEVFKRYSRFRFRGRLRRNLRFDPTIWIRLVLFLYYFWLRERRENKSRIWALCLNLSLCSVLSLRV